VSRLLPPICHIRLAEAASDRFDIGRCTTQEKYMFKKQIIAIALLGATVTLAHAQDATKKDPKSGKNCVTLFSSEPTENGLVRMNFRNTCDSPFQVQIEARERTRQASITAGTPEAPAKAYVTCKADDVCEAAKWKYN
jgi:hypothetical protein